MGAVCHLIGLNDVTINAAIILHLKRNSYLCLSCFIEIYNNYSHTPSKFYLSLLFIMYMNTKEPGTRLSPRKLLFMRARRERAWKILIMYVLDVVGRGYQLVVRVVHAGHLIYFV